jgi:hypothetical protein
VAGPPAEDGPVREQLSVLRSMLVLAMLLTQQDNQASILHLVAHAVESLGSCGAEGIFLDGQWQDIRLPRRGAASLPALGLATEGGPVTLADVPWSWAYSLSSRHGPVGYLLVGAQVRQSTGNGSCCRCWPSRPGWRWPTRACTPGIGSRPRSCASPTSRCSAAWRFTTG